MCLNTNYPAIRRDASGLIRFLSYELKQCNNLTIMMNPSTVLDYATILAWLSTVICSDLDNVHELVDELETMTLPECLGSHKKRYAQGQFESLRKEVRRCSEMALKQTRPDDTPAIYSEDDSLFG